MNTTSFDLQQEADYVLGMMDMYGDDKEIAEMLRMKGLSHEEVKKVIDIVRLDGYRKRIRQAKKIFIIGSIIAIIGGVAWWFLVNAGIYNRRDEAIERFYAGWMIDITFWAFIYGLLMTGVGIFRFISYSSKLRKAETNS